MIGQNMMATPTTMDSTVRTVYFPGGIWYDYNSGKQYIGEKSYKIEITTDKLPLFVKDGSIVPVATPLNFVDDNVIFEITCKVFGEAPTSFTLFEDDGITYNFLNGNFNKLVLNVVNGKGSVERKGNFNRARYNVKNWEFFK